MDEALRPSQLQMADLGNFYLSTVCAARRVYGPDVQKCIKQNDIVQWFLIKRTFPCWWEGYKSWRREGALGTDVKCISQHSKERK